jgi:hypothetical protein
MKVRAMLSMGLHMKGKRKISLLLYFWSFYISSLYFLYYSLNKRILEIIVVQLSLNHRYWITDREGLNVIFLLIVIFSWIPFDFIRYENRKRQKTNSNQRTNSNIIIKVTPMNHITWLYQKYLVYHRAALEHGPDLTLLS